MNQRILKQNHYLKLHRKKKYKENELLKSKYMERKIVIGLTVFAGSGLAGGGLGLLEELPAAALLGLSCVFMNHFLISL